MTSKVLVLATLATKGEETDYLLDHLRAHGVSGKLIDMSLQSGGAIFSGADKLAAMEAAATRAIDEIASKLCPDVHAVIALGGGTGGEIALRVLRSLPITFPKVLVTTLPFDPRYAASDSSIVLVPTLADICGLNATLREVLENAAALTAGLCQTRRQTGACVENTSIGITALGATEGAVANLVQALRASEQESTVFHSNGFGGAAFTRFAQRGAFHALVDLTPHELTRMHVAGAFVPMPDRFSAARDLPRVILPGGLNFVGLGEKSLVPQRFLDRPYYEHSGYFTHAKVTADEMEMLAARLAASLNICTGPRTIIVPLGGFSHQDRPGGAIEDEDLRHVFRDALVEHLDSDVNVLSLPQHINDPAITNEILRALDNAAFT